MSCIHVILICDWCQKVPVGSSHCCPPVGHGILCPDCAKYVLEWAELPPPTEETVRFMAGGPVGDGNGSGRD